ncbi:MAG: hypothetical protein ACI4DK_13415 [Lachnospiraceae bacterium]
MKTLRLIYVLISYIISIPISLLVLLVFELVAFYEAIRYGDVRFITDTPKSFIEGFKIRMYFTKKWIEYGNEYP